MREVCVTFVSFKRCYNICLDTRELQTYITSKFLTLIKLFVCFCSFLLLLILYFFPCSFCFFLFFSFNNDAFVKKRFTFYTFWFQGKDTKLLNHVHHIFSTFYYIKISLYMISVSFSIVTPTIDSILPLFVAHYVANNICDKSLMLTISNWQITLPYYGLLILIQIVQISKEKPNNYSNSFLFVLQQPIIFYTRVST